LLPYIITINMSKRLLVAVLDDEASVEFFNLRKMGAADFAAPKLGSLRETSNNPEAI